VPPNDPHLDLVVKTTSGTIEDRWNRSQKAKQVYDEVLRRLDLPDGQYILKRERDGLVLNLAEKLGDLGLVDGDVLILQAHQPKDG
jgi:hypothetical protein